MSRSSMVDLIARLRRMVGDGGEPPVFEDDTLEEELDRLRCRHARETMEEERSVDSSQVVSYLRFFMADGDWEGDVLIQNASFQSLTPETSDYKNGVWTFASTPLRPLTITGWTYDLYGTAVEILEQWIAELKLEFNFQTEKNRFDRSQKIEHLTALADRYRGKMRPSMAVVVRSDTY